jgi:hypothetical protein
LFDWLKDASTPSNKPWERLLEATEDSRVLNGLAEKTYLTTHETAQTILQENATSLLVYLLDTTIAELAKRNRGVR